MQVKDLEKYNFHDSGLLRIEKENDFIRLTILCCLYEQEWYEEGQPEHAIITITFRNIINSEIPNKQLHNDEIIDEKINGNKYTLNLENSYTRDFYIINIEAEIVEVEIVETISDLGKYYEDNNL